MLTEQNPNNISYGNLCIASRKGLNVVSGVKCRSVYHVSPTFPSHDVIHEIYLLFKMHIIEIYR